MPKKTRLAGTHISRPAICWSCSGVRPKRGGVLAGMAQIAARREQHDHAGQIGRDRRRHHHTARAAP